MANNRMRPRDQLRYPGVGDIQAVMHPLAAKQVPHFMLLFDVRKAHRLVPVREEDWGYQACLVDGDFDEHGEQQVWLNKVGTFGMSSAAYWWGRAAAGEAKDGLGQVEDLPSFPQRQKEEQTKHCYNRVV